MAIKKICDKCGKDSDEIDIIDISYIKINTDSYTTDKVYVDEDPQLCKECFKKLKKEMKILIKSFFGYC